MKYDESLVGYIIVGKSKWNEEAKFYSIDKESGGVPYWSPMFSDAEIFSLPVEAGNIIRGKEFTEETQTVDGTIYPPRMVQDGANICNATPMGELEVSIRRIELLTIGEKTFLGMIQKPRGILKKGMR